MSAGLLQHGKRVLQRLNDVQKGQGWFVFVAAKKVALQTFGKVIMEPMSASALMFFNCCQRACESCTSKATLIMIRWKHWYFHQIIGVPVMRRRRPDNP